MKTTKQSKLNKPRPAGVKATRSDDAPMAAAPSITETEIASAMELVDRMAEQLESDSKRGAKMLFGQWCQPNSPPALARLYTRLARAGTDKPKEAALLNVLQSVGQLHGWASDLFAVKRRKPDPAIFRKRLDLLKAMLMPSDPRAAALNRIASLAQTLGGGDLLIEYRRQRKLCADLRRDASPTLHQQLAMLDRWAVSTRQLDAMRGELRELIRKYMPKVYESLPMLANMQHWETCPDIDWESFGVEMRRVETAAMDAAAVGGDALLPEDRSVPMTLKQIGSVFGYSSIGGIRQQAQRIGLKIPAKERGGCTFAMSALTSEQRRQYETNLKTGKYKSKWEPQQSK